MTFQPSRYQQKVFDWYLTSPKSNLVIQAKPGSGKTTTLVQLSRLIGDPRDAIFVAFNKHIAEELQQKLPLGMTAKTLHSLGFAALRNAYQIKGWKTPKIDGYLHNKFAKEWMREKDYELNLDRERRFEVIAEVKTLVNLIQLNLLDPYDENAIWLAIDHYGLDFKTLNPAIDGARAVLSRIKRETRKHISFNEMIWLPIIEGYPVKQYGSVLADEAQDFNCIQQEFVKRLSRDGGKTIWTGDARQAIYGFSFAATSGMQDIIDETNADSLPLSICYRCPQIAIDLANEIYPGIEPRHNAPKGNKYNILDLQVEEAATKGDLILCRVNAPLIPLCFSLIKAGVNAQVKGRDIGQNLISKIKKIDKKYTINWDDPYVAFESYLKDEKRSILRTVEDEDESAMKIQRVEDIVECLKAIWDGSNCDSVYCMEDTISRIFADEGAAIWLSTVHKAKGLEAESVFILHPSLMPHPMAKREWEIEQEWNLLYIALTRTMLNIYFAWPEEDKNRPDINASTSLLETAFSIGEDPDPLPITEESEQ